MVARMHDPDAHGSQITVMLPQWGAVDVILRVSNWTEASGFSSYIEDRNFAGDVSGRYYVLVLLEAGKSRYVIIPLTRLREVMEVPIGSETFQKTGRYAFNFGKANPNKLGKWGGFIDDPSVLLRSADVSALPTSALKEIAVRARTLRDAATDMLSVVERYLPAHNA